jgi:hypothetical protein
MSDLMKESPKIKMLNLFIANLKEYTSWFIVPFLMSLIFFTYLQKISKIWDPNEKEHNFNP